MGLFSGWDPVGDISNAGRSVANVVNEVAKGVENVFTEISKPWEDFRSNFLETGDVGKTLKAGFSPVAGYNAALKSGFRGNFGQAAKEGAGAIGNSNYFSQIINSSSSAKDLFETKEANNLTLGWSKEASTSTDSYNNLAAGKDLTKEETSNLVRFNARSVVYGAGVGYAAGSGAAGKAGSYIAKKPLEAATLGIAASQGNYGKVADAILPGSGQFVNSFNPSKAPTKSPASNDMGGMDPYITFDGGLSGIPTIAIVAGIALVGAAIFLARRK